MLGHGQDGHGTSVIVLGEQSGSCCDRTARRFATAGVKGKKVPGGIGSRNPFYLKKNLDNPASIANMIFAIYIRIRLPWRLARKRCRGDMMARPIEATPMLKGKDAKVFLEQTKISEPISAERKLWMARLVAEAKASEK